MALVYRLDPGSVGELPPAGEGGAMTGGDHDQVEPLGERPALLEPGPGGQLRLLPLPRASEVDDSARLAALLADLDRFWPAGAPCPACLGTGKRPERRTERRRVCLVCGVAFVQVYAGEGGHGRGHGGRRLLYCGKVCRREALNRRRRVWGV